MKWLGAITSKMETPFLQTYWEQSLPHPSWYWPYLPCQVQQWEQPCFSFSGHWLPASQHPPSDTTVRWLLFNNFSAFQKPLFPSGDVEGALRGLGLPRLRGTSAKARCRSRGWQHRVKCRQGKVGLCRSSCRCKHIFAQTTRDRSRTFADDIPISYKGRVKKWKYLMPFAIKGGGPSCHQGFFKNVF